MFCVISCVPKTSSKKGQETEKITQLNTTDKLSVKDFDIDLIISTPVDYIDLIKGKDIAIVGNQTSTIKNDKSTFIHLVDTLLSLKMHLKKVFTPEHGFRGTADAGEHVADGRDSKTQLPLISLHGKIRKPSPTQLEDVEVMIFDIQDVGVRFYTYLSTLHDVMEACAENKIPLILIDRPNPNAHYIDGPVMEDAHTGYLGKHPVPIVYGMTIGEYGKMINGEKWLKNGIHCDLRVMPMKNFKYENTYNIPIKPSPNLPNDKSINLYPSLGLFEGTSINAGRGTDLQFQIFGAPYLPKNKYNYQYIPGSNVGAKNPKQIGNTCNGLDLQKESELSTIQLNWLIDAYKSTPKGEEFFQATFTAHAGTLDLQKQIESGKTVKEIKESWQKGLDIFKKTREKYLIYN